MQDTPHETMPFLAPILTTPLLKIPLLTGHALCVYWSMTPPRKTAPSSEQKTIGDQNPDFMSKQYSWILRYCTSTAKVRYHIRPGGIHWAHHLTGGHDSS